MIESLKKRILAARNEILPELVLKGGWVVNVFSGEIQKKDVAVYDGIIVGVGYDLHGKKKVDLTDRWIVPGLIDGHIHIESSMLLPSNLAMALLVHGTTSIISDPHEIANVLGLPGIRFMLEESQNLPFDIFLMAPSCVPATHLETAGAELKAADLMELKDDPRVLGLAEMMNFPGVLVGDEQALEKIALFSDMIIDGHCPSVRGRDLDAYMTAGIRSDHEATSRIEGLEKMESGMTIMIREGTSAKNLEALLPLVNDRNSRRFCFVSDDLHSEDIQDRGHLDFIIKKAVRLGMDPVTAIQLATLNTAEYFGLKDRGAIAPGYSADLVVLDDLESFKVASVYKNGSLVADKGKLLNFPMNKGKISSHFFRPKPLNIAPFTPESFLIPHPGGKARIIDLLEEQIITRMSHEDVKSEKGLVVSDIESDILKLCVVERHKAGGNIGLGLVRGFGLRHGAMASSVAHDSHNVIVVGVNDNDIFRAVETVRSMGGGLAVVSDDKTLAKTPLEIAGLMSMEPLDTLAKQLRLVTQAASMIGCRLKNPFMALSFLSLPVIPELKLTDRGLVDVNKFEIVSLFF